MYTWRVDEMCRAVWRFPTDHFALVMHTIAIAGAMLCIWLMNITYFYHQVLCVSGFAFFFSSFVKCLDVAGANGLKEYMCYRQWRWMAIPSAIVFIGTAKLCGLW